VLCSGTFIPVMASGLIPLISSVDLGYPLARQKISHQLKNLDEALANF
jgi:hypothetical protein